MIVHLKHETAQGPSPTVEFFIASVKKSVHWTLGDNPD